MSDKIKELDALTKSLEMLRTKRPWFYYNMLRTNSKLRVSYAYSETTHVIRYVMFGFEIPPIKTRYLINVYPYD